MTTSEYMYYADKLKQINNAIVPICEAFHINDYGYEIDENGKETLVLEGQKIGCTSNSVSAVVNELIGYIIVTRYCRDGCLGVFEKQTKNHIKRNWIN